jgi:UPF0755 protein
MRIFRTLAALVLVGAAVAGALVVRDYHRFADTPLALPQGGRTLDIEPGTPFNRIVSKLRREGYTRAHPWYWRALAWEMGVADGLHAGEYALCRGETPRRLLARMARGDVVQHRFTIVEGWTFRELRAALAKDAGLKQETAARPEADLMEALGAAGRAPEGRFLPETYAYTKGMSDLQLLKRARAAMDDALAKAWAARNADTPLKSPDEGLILASIIEKETGRADERARIGGVFARRLKLGMKLQTDPTVIYGLGAEFNGNLTRKHLQADGPYNSYTRFGLPPTPIALPGKDALNAATRPAPGEDLYFVARGDGSHEFTASLREHNAAVARYQLRRN